MTAREAAALNVEQRGQVLADVTESRQDARDRLAAAVRDAAALGVPETELARLAGVDRLTIRRMRGKGGR